MKCKHLILFTLIFGLLLCTCACTSAWISSLGSLIPVIQTAFGAVLTFVLALQGKTISESTAAAIQKVSEAVKSGLSEASALVNDFKASADQSILGKLTTVFTQVQTDLGSLLQAFSVTDQATATKFQQLVGLVVMAVESVLALIPAAKKAAATMSGAQLQHADAEAAALTAHHAKYLKESYNAVVNETTGSADVDGALETLPKFDA